MLNIFKQWWPAGILPCFCTGRQARSGQLGGFHISWPGIQLIHILSPRWQPSWHLWQIKLGHPMVDRDSARRKGNSAYFEQLEKQVQFAHFRTKLSFKFSKPSCSKILMVNFTLLPILAKKHMTWLYPGLAILGHTHVTCTFVMASIHQSSQQCHTDIHWSHRFLYHPLPTETLEHHLSLYIHRGPVIL